MKILVDNGAYSLRNMGDVAMLQILLERIRNHCKPEEIAVLTTNPELLSRYCPGTVAVSVAGRDTWYEPHQPGTSLWREMWIRKRPRIRIGSDAKHFRRVFADADAVLLGGGGFLNDLNPLQTRSVFRMLAHAGEDGKRTALFSQGLGPLSNPELTALLSYSLSAGAFAGVRERLRGPEILLKAGAQRTRFSFTGDDALEMACSAPDQGEGTALGFSVRKVGYSGLEPVTIRQITTLVREVQKTLNTHVVPLPISFNPHEQDLSVIEGIIGQHCLTGDLDDPSKLIHAVGCCRMLITGTYHAAVFALAQGIPCLCFYASDYYRHKMEGLAAEYPLGCKTIDLTRSKDSSVLLQTALQLWENSVGVREQLRTTASQQVKLSRAFFQGVFSC